MNAKDQAKKHLDETQEMLTEMQHALECERHLLSSKPGYNWADAGDVCEVNRQLKKVISFWNGGDDA
jgi:hypothetical protein